MHLLKKKLMNFLETLKINGKKIIPSAVKTLENNMQHCTTFYSFPEEEWVSIRSSNVIERLHKEFKRRTKSMEIVGGELSCYLLLSFISLKMEAFWKAHPIGEINNNVKNLKYINKTFTQNY